MRVLEAFLPVVCLVVACGGSVGEPTTTSPGTAGDSCTPSKDACEGPDSQLRACVDFPSGIYGSAVDTCATHCPPDYGGCMEGVAIFTVTPNQGGGAPKTTSVSLEGGVFALPLSPGGYEICFTDSNVTNRGCTHVEIRPNELTRVSAGVTVSPGGRYAFIR